ncbi:molybdenum cofactor guanylyltransferase MobA [Diaphorobacter ruginosibacter]|uniref:molybdenum cofactor guanylyltransferase MobA n=1 Tax=Diaphorobacter ruginosibacter TaxID=1715720 RepID=UPI001FEB1762|nr:molybdenum cofactor guanylyltransferase MobA [Diaphorobacter ruginosibacter]
MLAGGRASRFGGEDKGLQTFLGRPLAQIALERLTPQVGRCALSANRHLADYEAFGAPVWRDSLPDFPGPLAGMLSGLERIETEWLLTVPCDSPRFPPDLARRLCDAAARDRSTCAFACAPDQVTGDPRMHPVFCLLHRDLRASLGASLSAGEHRVMRWLQSQPHSIVAFDLPADDPQAFANTNTPDDLRRLEALSRHAAPPEHPLDA